MKLLTAAQIPQPGTLVHTAGEEIPLVGGKPACLDGVRMLPQDRQFFTRVQVPYMHHAVGTRTDRPAAVSKELDVVTAQVVVAQPTLDAAIGHIPHQDGRPAHGKEPPSIWRDSDVGDDCLGSDEA